VSIVITGHSLGGAMATLMSLKIKKYCDVWTAPNDSTKKICQLKQVYAMEAPRAGSPAFVELYNAAMAKANVNVFLLVNKYDPVPRIPFMYTPLFGSYRHAGNMVYYPPDAPGTNPPTPNANR